MIFVSAFLELPSWFVEKLIVLSSSFGGPGFVSVRTVGDYGFSYVAKKVEMRMYVF